MVSQSIIIAVFAAAIQGQILARGGAATSSINDPTSRIIGLSTPSGTLNVDLPATSTDLVSELGPTTNLGHATTIISLSGTSTGGNPTVKQTTHTSTDNPKGNGSTKETTGTTESLGKTALSTTLSPTTTGPTTSGSASSISTATSTTTIASSTHTSASSTSSKPTAALQGAAHPKYAAHGLGMVVFAGMALAVL